MKKNKYDGKNKNNINNKGDMYGEVCLVVIVYIYYYVSNNGELFGIQFMFGEKKKTESERIEVINIIILMMSVS